MVRRSRLKGITWQGNTIFPFEGDGRKEEQGCKIYFIFFMDKKMDNFRSTHVPRCLGKKNI